MMKEISIGKPYVKSLGKVSRLEALITGPDIMKIHYFEVSKEYEQYLCWERSDAFVVSLFYFALINGYNIKCTAPMSQQLYYQLTRILIPSMVKYHPDFFNNIKITAELDNKPISNARGVGASVSGGVDSFYTIVSNMNTEVKDYDITHLLIANSYNIYKGEEDTRRRFKETVEHSQIIADELGLPLIRIYSNHSEFWYQRYQNIFCLKYASYPYALQKLFSIYYFSSGYGYSDFSVTPKDWDSARYDALSAPQVSNENLAFILSGGEVSRTDKVVSIADNSVVRKRLQVCNLHQENCSMCYKCMRTQLSLYACNKLDEFEQVFNLNEFYKKIDKTLIGLLSVKSIYDRENLELMKKNNVQISLKTKVLGKIGRTLYLIRQLIKRIPIVHGIYNKVKKADEFTEIEKYNMDKEFARKCDSGII